MKGAEEDYPLATHSNDCQKTTSVQEELLGYRKDVKTTLQNAEKNIENK